MAMFPDSNIAKMFQCYSSKSGCGSKYGITPYLLQLFYREISLSPIYLISFVEPCNRTQMKSIFWLNFGISNRTRLAQDILILSF